MLGSSLDLEHVIDRIPHLGVDIEERTDQYLRIEYNPNRPDFSTDYGIIRSLKGLLKIELGLPEYRVHDGKTIVSTDPSISKIRPHILCLEATNLNLDEESLRQLISMQEDLHNGIGRKRRKVSIGFHDFNSFTPPLKYTTMTKDFQFTPLGSSRKMSIEDILRDTEQGVTYGSILDGFEDYPLIIDSNGQTISFPPIINSEITKLTNNSRNLFVEITATDLSAAQDVLMVVSSTLHDAGSTLHSVKISYPDREMITPDMAPVTRNLKTTEVNRLLGTEL
ncbi:MAG: phenylalanine--tRNA ligase beta subunit-related protein, partial [Nitrosopumilus sp.]